MTLTDELLAQPGSERKGRMEAIVGALSETDRDLLMHHIHDTGHLTRPSSNAYIARMLTRGGHKVSSSSVGNWRNELGDE